MIKITCTILFLLISFSNGINLIDIENKIINNKNNTVQRIDNCAEKIAATPEVITIFDKSECDLISDGPICLYNGDRVLLPYAKPKNLIGYWNFDDLRPLDNSGNKNHAIGLLKAGPAFAGNGNSAIFTSDFIKIPYNEMFTSSDFSITFILFVVKDDFSKSKGNRFCPFIQRGDDNLNEKTFQRGPAIYFDRKDKNLKIYISTSEKDNQQGEVLTSNARISFQRWLHISLIKSKKTLKLYINGILDSKIELKGTPVLIESPLYLGGVSWLKDQCNMTIMIDEMRYYNMSIEEDRIQAEASPLLGGIEPNFLQLGCIECNLKEAATICPENYRLCSSIELHTGGYQIARSMGWLLWDTHIWTFNALKTPSEFEKLKGLALCCIELK